MNALLVLGGLLLCVLGARAVSTYQRTATYQDDIVVRCPDKRKPSVQVLQAHADIWHLDKDSIDLRLKRKAFARVQKYFRDCQVVVANVEEFMQQAEAQMFPTEQAQEQAWVQEVMASTIPKCNMKQCEKLLDDYQAVFQNSNTWFKEYHNYNEIRGFYKKLGEGFPTLVKYVPSIGKSHQGRDMPAVHITASTNDNRKRFYMQCQIHAREWITGSVCMYVAQYLVKRYGKDNEVTRLMDNMEFVMVPIVNPDGMVYTWVTDRLWRKNRRKHSGAQCPGVDINRNFPLGFAHSDISEKSCAEDYGGPEALSENESSNIVRYFRANAPIVGSIDWHSYGQLLLRPYGYSNMTSHDETYLKDMTEEMARLSKSVHNQHYTPERSQDLYPCYGIAADWLYSNDAASTNKGFRSASVCIELRDKSGNYGFVLPADQILPTAEEIVPAFLHYAKTVLDKPLLYTRQSKKDQPPFDEHHIRHRHR